MDTNYALGSVLNHVLLHQTVIGQEAMAQMELAGEEPDVIVACVGGGSNFAGMCFPFLRRVLHGHAATRFVACGHGHFDLGAYDAYLAGELEDPEFSEADMNAALERLPDVPAPA